MKNTGVVIFVLWFSTALFLDKEYSPTPIPKELHMAQDTIVKRRALLVGEGYYTYRHVNRGGKDCVCKLGEDPYTKVYRYFDCVPDTGQ